MRHEATENSSGDDRHQTDAPPQPHGTRLRVTDKDNIRIGHGLGFCGRIRRRKGPTPRRASLWGVVATFTQFDPLVPDLRIALHPDGHPIEGRVEPASPDRVSRCEAGHEECDRSHDRRDSCHLDHLPFCDPSGAALGLPATRRPSDMWITVCASSRARARDEGPIRDHEGFRSPPGSIPCEPRPRRAAGARDTRRARSR